MSTYPKIAYQSIASTYANMIVQRKLLRETVNFYIFEDRYIIGQEDKVSKSRTNVFFTFAEAKAHLVKRKQIQVERLTKDLEIARADLLNAGNLTGPTHVDKPVPMPTGPLKI